MNKPFESKIFMYDTVITYCDSRMDVINSIPALLSSYNAFKQIVSNIRQTLQLSAQVITGFAGHKAKLRKELAEEAGVLAAKLASYAETIDDIVLLDSVNITTWKLERLKDEELTPVCQNLLLAANNTIASLAPYNVLPDTVAAFDAHIQAYAAVVTTPRNAVTMRRKHFTKLKGLFKAADDMLKGSTDRQVRQFKISNPEFYLSYKYNRELVGNGSTRTQIKGTVTDDSTDEPVVGVVITIVEIDTRVTTGEDGNYLLKPVPPATYTITFEKEGFDTKTVSGQEVKQGKIVRVDVSLVKTV